MNNWISIKDRLPTGHEYDGWKAQPVDRPITVRGVKRCPCRYLAVWQGKSIDIAYFIDGHFRLYGEIKDHLITHWQPLPELPDENKEV